MAASLSIKQGDSMSIEKTELGPRLQLDIELKGAEFTDTHCIVCGRRLSGKKFWVHMSTLGGWIPVAEEDGQDDDQGWFEIGSGCAKAFPAEYKTTW